MPFREFMSYWKHFIFPVWSLFVAMYFHNKCSRHTARCIDEVSLWHLCFTGTQYSPYSLSSLCFLIMWLNMLIDLTASFIHRESTLSSIRFIFKASLWSGKSPVPFQTDVWVCSACCLCMLWNLQALKKSPLGHGWDLFRATVLTPVSNEITPVVSGNRKKKQNSNRWWSSMYWYHRRKENRKGIRTRVSLMVTPTPWWHLGCPVESSPGLASSDQNNWHLRIGSEIYRVRMLVQQQRAMI